jgi:hypothetical protein
MNNKALFSVKIETFLFHSHRSKFFLHSIKTKKPPAMRKALLRSRADSNRCGRFCRPLPSLSATRPHCGDAKVIKNSVLNLNQSSIIIATFSTSPFIGAQILVILTFNFSILLISCRVRVTIRAPTCSINFDRMAISSVTIRFI